MQNGVCSKALKSGEDFGYCRRNLQWGIHGKHRNGKLEYPGLLARGIISVTGYVKGGRAPGGDGLTPTYTINREVLLNYIPEVDDGPEPPESSESPSSEPVTSPNSPKKDETLDKTKGETFKKNGETKGVHAPPSSLSSSLTPHNGDEPALRPDRGEGRGVGAVVVVENSENFNYSASPFVSPTRLPAVALGEPQVDAGQGRNHSNYAVTKPLNENQSQRLHIESQTQEARAEHLIAANRQKQLDRKASDVEIFREYKAVFDRLAREKKIYLDWSMPTATHRKEAADLYRTLGRDAALAEWEDFLINDDHDHTEPMVDEETGKTIAVEVQRKWLFYDFVLARGGATQRLTER